MTSGIAGWLAAECMASPTCNLPLQACKFGEATAGSVEGNLFGAFPALPVGVGSRHFICREQNTPGHFAIQIPRSGAVAEKNCRFFVRWLRGTSVLL